ncbi:unnamed protein product [Notodromas monacha]|uniref:Uncharacterized protein n=1 Tax=Notodromas monacha TaxID=399045 RepID=A0A7R9BUL6_9CRUS|nr:unnamed protein product [Notodromas monacha]CAG0920694.1 unnamed protein product [Notodromas monacha]
MRESDLRGYFGEDVVPEKESVRRRAKEIARSYSLILALFGLILIFLAVWATLTSLEDEKFRGEVIVSEFNVLQVVEKTKNFDYVIFTQLWPETSCIHYRHSTPARDCRVPSTIQQWAVHGLWPSVDSGPLGPFYCNRSDKFDMKLLEPLEPELSVRWPNLFVETEEGTLWEHEWTKHGTCAMQLSELSDEVKYFGAGLKMWDQFNIFGALKQAGIEPSLKKGYQAHDIFNAVKGAFGVSPRVECLIFHGKQMQKIFLLNQIEICFDKSLNAIDCAPKSQSFFEGCSLGSPVFYPPPFP